MNGSMVHTNGWGPETEEVRGSIKTQTRLDGATVLVAYKYWLEQPRTAVPTAASVSQIVEQVAFVVAFDAALMAAMDRPWRDIAFWTPEIVASGSAPPDFIPS